MKFAFVFVVVIVGAVVAVVVAVVTATFLLLHIISFGCLCAVQRTSSALRCFVMSQRLKLV